MSIIKYKQLYIKHVYDNDDVFLAIPTPNNITPDMRYEMRNSVYSIDLNLDGNEVKFPIIYTHSSFGIRVSSNNKFIDILRNPKIESINIVDEDWQNTFDKSSVIRLNYDAEYPPTEEDYIDLMECDGIEEDQIRCNCEEAIFTTCTVGEEDEIRRIYPMRSMHSLTIEKNPFYSYSEDILSNYYKNYTILSKDIKANKVFISLIDKLYDRLIMPHICLGSVKEYNNEKQIKLYSRKVFHKRLKKYGYWLDKTINSNILSKLN